jgi:hypothetical protein
MHKSIVLHTNLPTHNGSSRGDAHVTFPSRGTMAARAMSPATTMPISHLQSLSLISLSFSLSYSSQRMDQAHPGASTTDKARRVQQGRASHSVSGRPEHSEHSAQWRQPPTVHYGENQSGASWHHQVSFQEPLSHGHSPSSFSSRSTSSVEQSALGEPLQESAAHPSLFHPPRTSP